MSHVQLNPSATRVMMRLSVANCPIFGALGCIDLETGETHVIPDKPVHQLWFDDDTHMATRQYHDGTNFQKCIWELQIHPNPTFSRNAKRIYFNHPVSENRTGACFVELDDIV